MDGTMRPSVLPNSPSSVLNQTSFDTGSEHGASVKGDIGVGSILGQNVQPAALGAQQKLSIGASAIAAKVVNRVGLPFQTIGSQDVQGRIVQHVQALMCQQPQAPLPIVEEGFHLANLTAA